MFRARERGMSFWPFAVSLLGLIAFVIMWFSATSERDDAKRQAERAVADKKAAEEARDAANATLGKVSEAVNFKAGGLYTNPDEISRQLKDYGPRLRDTMTITFPVNRYQAAEGGGVPVKTENGNVTVQYLTDQELAAGSSLQDFMGKYETAAKRMKFDIDRAFGSLEQAIKDKEAVTKSDQDTITAKDKSIADLRGEKDALDRQMREKETELKDSIAQLTSQKDAKDTENETLRKQAAENEAKLLAKLNEAQGQVRTLVQRDAPTLSEGPDGEVIVADNGVAIVNRGKAQWLMPGTNFDVWGLAKGGAKYKKGAIKITSVDEETARGAIVEETNPRDPITKGDLIQSLTYSPNRQLHFVLVGDMKKMGRSQAEAVLTKLGAKIDAKVTSSTNYLVVGDLGGQNMDDNEAVKAAKDLGIRMITEDQLSSFTRY